MSKNNKIRIAVQKRGRMRAPSFEFLNSLGLFFPSAEVNDLILSCQNQAVDALLVRNRDIPEYVKNGVADFGIVGENVIYERGENYATVKKFDFGRCALVIAVPDSAGITVLSELDGKRIATSYPNSLRRYLLENGIKAEIVEINGSVEIAPLLNLADAVCDITQTGATLRKYGLTPITTILRSQAVMIASATNCNIINNFKEKYLYAGSAIRTI